jgi:hypothetical protein
MCNNNSEWFHCLAVAAGGGVVALVASVLGIETKTGSEAAKNQSRLQVEVRRRSAASGTPFQVRMP